MGRFTSSSDRVGRNGPRWAAEIRSAWTVRACVWALALLTGLAIAPACAADGASPPTAPAPRPEAEGSASDPIVDGRAVWYLLVLLSVASTALIIDHLVTIRRSRLMPAGVAQELEAKVKALLLEDTVRYCGDPKNDSLLTRLVLVGVERYRQNPSISPSEIRSAVQEEGTTQVARLYRRTEFLSAIGVAAPLLGLLGTVQSLIASLGVIAAAGDAARPADLAGAGSRALVCTALGLLVAIPALSCLSYFRYRIDAQAEELGGCVGQILQPLGRQG
jgi:biopolymer transport protein ExbB